MIEENEKSIDQFIAENHLEAKIVKLGRQTRDGWQCDSWNVMIHKGIKDVYTPDSDYSVSVVTSPLVTTYHMGIGHKGKKPQLRDVLDSLRSDAELVENNDPFEFMSEMGFDNPRKAREAYNACLKIRDDLKTLLGTTAYRELIESVERL